MTTPTSIGDELAVHIMSFIVEPKKKLTDDWEKNEELKEIIQKPYSDFWDNIFCYSNDISFIEDMKKRNYNVYNVYRNKEAGKILKDTQDNIKKKREILDYLSNDELLQEEQKILNKKLYDKKSFYIILSTNGSKEAVEIIKEEMKRYIDKNDKERPKCLAQFNMK
jgi:hypothetical protein